MTRSKVQERKACLRHQSYTTLDEAWAAARGTFRNKLRAFNHAELDTKPIFVRPWRCPRCKHFHIGTVKRK